MTCPHITTATKEYNACAIGRYGGKPSHGTCARCIERGENTSGFAAQLKSIKPSLPQQAASLGKSLINWTASRFTTTPPEALTTREATCRACPEWDAAALNATGRCRKCGCSTWAKLRMATERCPLGKWEPVTAAP